MYKHLKDSLACGLVILHMFWLWLQSITVSRCSFCTSYWPVDRFWRRYFNHRLLAWGGHHSLGWLIHDNFSTLFAKGMLPSLQLAVVCCVLLNCSITNTNSRIRYWSKNLIEQRQLTFPFLLETSQHLFSPSSSLLFPVRLPYPYSWLLCG